MKWFKRDSTPKPADPMQEVRPEAAAEPRPEEITPAVTDPEPEPAPAPQAVPEPPQAAAGDDALSVIGAIEEAFGGMESDAAASDTGFEYPLDKLLALFPPESLVAGTNLAALAGQVVTIEIPGLYDQLASGKVAVRMADLAFFVPVHLLDQQAFADRDTEVVLPLQDVVQAVGFDALGRHMAQSSRQYDVDWIDDPFKEAPEGAAPATAQQPEPETPAAPEPEPEPLLAPAELASAEREIVHAGETPPGATPGPVPGDTFPDLPGNVDINTASRAELLTLDGVSEALADRIVTYREHHGPFRSIFDLYEVARVGRKTFRRMTGMPYSIKRLHRRRRLARLLDIRMDQVTDVGLVAERVAALPGFSGCVISDGEGLMLAEATPDRLGEQFSAVVPRIVRQTRECMNVVKAGRLDSVSICTEGRMFTIVGTQAMALTAVHEERRVTKTQLNLVRRIGEEVAWLLSHRAYVASPEAGGGA
jgi:competence ComEA-like helix-hairpin-helix protein